MDRIETLKYINEKNAKYLANNCNGITSDASKNFKILDGKLPILLSAPHAVRQLRNGQVKFADTLTGPIVEFLCEKSGANGIVRTCNMEDDPNSENTGYGLEYKKAILGLAVRKNIKCMIEMHGCADNQVFDIDIGTNNGINIQRNQELMGIIYEQLVLVGRTRIDHVYSAAKDTTVCNYISKRTEIPCFQIEVSTSLRKTPDKLLQLLNSLETIIHNIERRMEANRENEER